MSSQDSNNPGQPGATKSDESAAAADLKPEETKKSNEQKEEGKDGDADKQQEKDKDDDKEKTSRGMATKFRVTTVLFAIISILGDVVLGFSEAAKDIEKVSDPDSSFGEMGKEAIDKFKNVTQELVKVTEIAHNKMKKFADMAREAIPQNNEKTGGAEEGDKDSAEEKKTQEGKEDKATGKDKEDDNVAEEVENTAAGVEAAAENTKEEVQAAAEFAKEELKDLASESKEGVMEAAKLTKEGVQEAEKLTKEEAKVALKKGEELAKIAMKYMVKLYETGIGYAAKYGVGMMGESDILEEPYDELNDQFNNELTTLSTFLNDAATNPESREAIKELAKALAVTAVTVIEDVEPEVMHVTDTAVNMVENITEKGTRGATATMISVVQSFLAEIPWVGGIIDIMIAMGKGFNTSAEVFKIFVSRNSGMVVSTAKGVKKTEDAIVNGTERIANAAKKVMDLKNKTTSSTKSTKQTGGNLFNEKLRRLSMTADFLSTLPHRKYSGGSTRKHRNRYSSSVRSRTHKKK